MKVLVLNGSPAGENSITLQTVRYWEILSKDCEFTVLPVGQRIRSMEKDFAPCRKALEEAELIVFCYPVYTFLVPAQLHRFVELMKESGLDLSGKAATQITTSKHFYDVTAHRFIQENCEDMGLSFIRGLSADMEDLLNETGRKQARDFFRFVRWSFKHRLTEAVPKKKEAAPAHLKADREHLPHPAKRDGKVVIVTDLSADGESIGPLQSMTERFRAVLPYETEVIDLAAFPFAGGCLGCFHCASSGKCIYKDGFDDFLRGHIQNADAIVYAFRVKDHSMGYRFKLYDDRQFCNGHRTVTMGKPVGYLIDGDLSREDNLRMLMEARSQVGGNFLAGTADNETDPDAAVDRMAAVLTYALVRKYEEPANFFGVGGLKIFRDLIWQMQGLMKEDHRFYKTHGFYDFPQKRKGRIAGMYLVGAMMNNPSLKKKMGGKMTEGMMLPYRKVLEKAKKETAEQEE